MEESADAGARAPAANGIVAAADPQFEMRVRGDEQPSLFTTEELLVPRALENMRKAVSAIHAVPLKESPTLNSRRLFDACILVAQLDARMRDKAQVARIRTEGLTPQFETRITELARLAGIPGKNYERIRDELNRLYEVSVHWNMLGEDSEVEWNMKSHFLSSLGFGTGKKRGLVRFSVDPNVLAIVLEPSVWATLSLQAMEGLGTAAAYALYQNAFRYVNTHAKVTAALPTATWIELLMGQTRYVVEDPEQGKRVVNYGDFKRRHLMDAIRRVNDVPALGYTLDLKEIKSGTRVAKLQFKFVAKQSHSLGVPLTWPADVLQVLTAIGLTNKEIEDLGQLRSHEEVAESLVRLKAAEARLRAKGKSITSKKSYFYGILQNVAVGGSSTDFDDEKIEAEARQQESQRVAEERHARAQEKFAQHQTDRFREILFQLPEPLRQRLFRDFEDGNQSDTVTPFVRKGWTPKNGPLLALLRSWIGKERVDVMEQLLPNPEDKSFEAWMAWKVSSAI